ncbi:fungal-specific transcription factor domain-containing protein [Dipodascopsis uninucleata]
MTGVTPHNAPPPNSLPTPHPQPPPLPPPSRLLTSSNQTVTLPSVQNLTIQPSGPLPSTSSPQTLQQPLLGGPSLEDSTRRHSNPEISAAMLMTRLGSVSSFYTPKNNSNFPFIRDHENESISSSDSDIEESTPSLRRFISDTLYSLDPSGSIFVQSLLPSDALAHSYIHAYITTHHPNHPFLHLPSFSPTSTPPPLLLSILSLGAHTSNDKDLASRLHVASKTMVNARIDTDTFSSRTVPLWVVQTVLLNTSFAAWAGDPRGLEFACSVKSFLGNLASGLRFELNHPRKTTREEWIHYEAAKRTYFAIFSFFGQLTAAFNFPPGITNNEHSILELPCSDEEWMSQSPSPVPVVQSASFWEAMDALLHSRDIRVSPFAYRILATGLFLECWSSRSSIVCDFQSNVDRLNSGVETWFRSFMSYGPSNRATRAGPLAIYRITKLRLYNMVAAPGQPDEFQQLQDTLRYHDVGEVLRSLRSYAVKVSLANNAIVAAEVAFNVLFPFSVTDTDEDEHCIDSVITSWEAAVTLTTWTRKIEREMALVNGDKGVYRFQPHQRELALLQNIRTVLDQIMSGEIGSQEGWANEVKAAGGVDRLSVFVGWWWGRRRRSSLTLSEGWGFGSITREVIGIYSEVVRSELVG